MQPDYTHITVVFDRSGSMDSIATDALGGFNHFIKTQQAVPGRATLSLFWFNDQITDGPQWVPLAEQAPLTGQDFQPGGWTALHDAIAVGITKTGRHLHLMPEAERPAKVIFVILTDGEENASREFSALQVREMIGIQRETYNWTFVFLAANQDAVLVGGNLGVQQDAAMTFAAKGKQTADTFDALTEATTSLRTGESEAFTFTADHRTRAVGWSDGAKVI